MYLSSFGIAFGSDSQLKLTAISTQTNTSAHEVWWKDCTCVTLDEIPRITKVVILLINRYLLNIIFI